MKAVCYEHKGTGFTSIVKDDTYTVPLYAYDQMRAVLDIVKTLTEIMLHNVDSADREEVCGLLLTIQDIAEDVHSE